MVFCPIIYLFTLYPDHRFPSPPIPSLPYPPFPVFSEKEEDSPVYEPTLVPQITVGLGTSPSTEARQGSPVRGTGSMSKQQSQGKLCSSHWGTHMKIKLHICCICAGGLRPVLVCSLVGGLVSWKAQGSRIVDSVGLLVKPSPLSSSGFLHLSPNSSMKLLELCLMFGYGYLPLFLSPA
jgi:hypothetical protein